MFFGELNNLSTVYQHIFSKTKNILLIYYQQFTVLVVLSFKKQIKVGKFSKLKHLLGFIVSNSIQRYGF
jgi:phage regulator Rha-like protein